MTQPQPLQELKQQEASSTTIAIEREKTRQVRWQYVISATVIALLSLMGTGYGVYRDALASEHELALQHQQFAHEEVWKVLDVYDNPAKRLPVLRYLTFGADKDPMTRWAQQQLAPTQEEVRQARERLAKLEKSVVSAQQEEVQLDQELELAVAEVDKLRASADGGERAHSHALEAALMRQEAAELARDSAREELANAKRALKALLVPRSPPMP